MYFADKKLKLNEHNKKLLSNFPQMADEYAKKPIEVMPYSRFKQFYTDGNRVPYEEYYNERRRRLNVLYFSVLMGYTQYIPALEDMLNAICEEYTWAFPAHMPVDKPPEEQRTKLDLFSSETAAMLAQILYLSEDLLSEGICRRIKYEIAERMIKPFKTNNALPEKGNWAAVCANGLITSMVYLGFHSELDLYLPALTGMLDGFLDSFQSDGYCTEGTMYWAYGFGNFVYAANTLRDYTDGEINYFENEKVKEIAKFGFYTYLDENITLPYSDGAHRINYNIGLYHFLKKEYPSLPLPDEAYQLVFGEDKRYRFSDLLRNLYWYDENLNSSPVKPKAVNYNYSQCYIRNMESYSFSCKGGNNKESHNHNDIGSFFVVYNKEFILDDLGWPEYDKEYFTEKRYENICASSLGHSVPIVNGTAQSPGEEFRAEIIDVQDNSVKMDIGKAYDIEKLKLIRTFILKDNSIVLTDEFDSEAYKVTERFITRIKPEIDGCNVKIGNVILAPEVLVKPVISSKEYITRHVIASGVKPVETAYFIDFCYDAGSNFKFTVNFN